MMDDQQFKTAVIQILINNFGISTAKIYEPMFLTKTRAEIINSLELLLKEFIGQDNANKQLECLYK